MPPAVPIPGPDTIPGLLAWWDPAADYVSLIGSDVDTWTSRDGNAYPLSQSTAALRPPWSASGLLSKPALNVSGGDYLSGSIALCSSIANASFTAYCVANLSPSGLNQSVWSMSHVSFAANYMVLGVNNTSDLARYQRGTIGNVSLGTDTIPSGPFYMGYFYDTTPYFRVNGSTQISTAALGSIGLSRMFLGAFSNGPGPGLSAYFNSWIGDVLFYDHILTSGEVSTLENWITSKYPGI